MRGTTIVFLHMGLPRLGEAFSEVHAHVSRTPQFGADASQPVTLTQHLRWSMQHNFEFFSRPFRLLVGVRERR